MAHLKPLLLTVKKRRTQREYEMLWEKNSMREGEKENRQRSRRTVCASLRNPAAYILCFLSLIKVILQHRHGYEATANMHVANRHTDVCVCVCCSAVWGMYTDSASMWLPVIWLFENSWLSSTAIIPSLPPPSTLHSLNCSNFIPLQFLQLFSSPLKIYFYIRTSAVFHFFLSIFLQFPLPHYLPSFSSFLTLADPITYISPCPASLAWSLVSLLVILFFCALQL